MARKDSNTIIIDKAIGCKIQEERIGLGLSRQQVAEKINVTHQQLEKYEKGTNRITTGRLIALAKALNTTAIVLLDGLEEHQALPTQHQRMCIEVSRNFMKIKDSQHQFMINMLVKTLSEGGN